MSPTLPLPPVSVVVPYSGPVRYLATVLEAILESDYPTSLIQVVVVECPQSGRQPDVWSRVARRLNGSWVRHYRPGFAPASARNAGVAASEGQLIVGLDGDMVVRPGHIRAHAEFHLTERAVTIGLRRFVRLPVSRIHTGVFPRLSREPDLVISASNRLGHFRDWRRSQLRRLADHAAPYELALGCNLAYPRDAAIAAGGWSTAFDGSFGYEDIEFASRLVRAGYKPVWADGAEALHLEDERASGWKVDRARNFALACRLIPGFRAHRTTGPSPLWCNAI